MQQTNNASQRGRVRAAAGGEGGRERGDNADTGSAANLITIYGNAKFLFSLQNDRRSYSNKLL